MIKIRKNRFLFIVLVMGLTLLISGCTSHSRLRRISENMEVNIDSCKIDNEKDTHGGFLGDGDYFAKIICHETKDDEIESKWKKLPLSKELQKIMDMKQCGDGGCKDVYEKYSIPNIESGYYYFLDRFSEAKNNRSEEELNKRSSYNFSVGIYDSVNKVLYYYELDT